MESELTQASEELITKWTSDEQIHQLMMLMPAGVYTCDAEGRVTFFNRRAAELLGCEPKPGESHEQFCRSFRLWRLDGSPLPQDQAPMATALENSKSFRNTEVIVERPDGSKIIVSASIDALRDSAGRFCGVISVFQDVSELKENQGARANLAAIVESSEDAIIGKDLDGIITSWNAGAEKLYGYTADEVIGKSICLLNATGQAFVESQILDRLRRGDTIERYEAVHAAKDGRRVDASITVSPIRDATGRVIGASRIARDISERKKAEAELAAWHHELEMRVAKRTEELHRAYESLQGEVEERKRLESEIARAIERDQLRLGQELHDGLGQELTGIAYHMAALRGRLKGVAPACARDVKKLESIILRSVEQTRNLARGFYPVDLEAHGLPSALQQLASSTKDSFGVSCVVTEEETFNGALIGPVAIQLFRIAQEAVHNAVKHAKAKQILIRLAKTDGNVTLTVQDDGVGLPPNLAEVKGMGLRIMQHRASLIGAKMEFANGPDKGAIITCIVPHEEWLLSFPEAATDSENESILTLP
jgi:PAS domain S-box-containing protein